MNKRLAALMIALAFTVGVLLSGPPGTTAQESPLLTESPLPTPTRAPDLIIDCGGQPVTPQPTNTPWPTDEPTWTAIPELIIDCGGPTPAPTETTPAPTATPAPTPTSSAAYYQGPCGQCPIPGLCDAFPADATCIIVVLQ